MKIEDIVTDQDGLKKIIDFLHSEENFAKMDRLEYTPAFHLASAETKMPGSVYIGNQQPNIQYVVSLESSESHPEQASRLLDLVKEVYKKG